MTTQDIANDLVAMCREGKWEESGEKYWADDVISVEFSGGDDAVAKGKDAVRGKSQWFMGAHEIHSANVEGPWVNGEQFIVRFGMDMTNKESGQRMQMQEAALYTVRGGKIVEERFFFGG